MQYQIYVPLPSLISVDGTDLPYPRLAHMACDHSVEKMKKNTEAWIFLIKLVRVMSQLMKSTFKMISVYNVTIHCEAKRKSDYN